MPKPSLKSTGSFLKMSEIETGKEILDSFFAEMSKKDGLHKPTVDALVGLHNENKFTKTNIENALEAAREKPKDI